MLRSILLVVLVTGLAGCGSMQVGSWGGWGSSPEPEAAEVREIDTRPSERRSDEQQAASGTREGAAEDEITEADPADAEPTEAAAAPEPEQEPAPAPEPAAEPEEQEAEQATAAAQPAPEPEPAPAAAQQPEPRSSDVTGVVGAYADVPQAEHPPLTDAEYQALQSELSRMESAGEDTSGYREEIERGRSEGGVMAWFYRRWLESRVSETPVFFYR